MKRRPTARDYPRTARLNTLVREILGEELERIDDERLELVSLTSVVVDADLKRAVAYYDHSRGDDAEAEIEEAFAALRPRLQRAVARQTTLKRTPELRFEADGVLRNAQRIEEILQGLTDIDRGGSPSATPAGGPVPAGPGTDPGLADEADPPAAT